MRSWHNSPACILDLPLYKTRVWQLDIPLSMDLRKRPVSDRTTLELSSATFISHAFLLIIERATGKRWKLGWFVIKKILRDVDGVLVRAWKVLGEWVSNFCSWWMGCVTCWPVGWLANKLTRWPTPHNWRVGYNRSIIRREIYHCWAVFYLSPYCFSNYPKSVRPL